MRSGMTAREQVDPGDIPGTGRGAVLKRTVKEFQKDNVTDWAAALTYYAVLSLFPALIALASLLGLFGQGASTVTSVTNVLSTAGASQSVVDSLKSVIEGVVSNKSGAGFAFVLGLLGALYSASNYIGAFFRASNSIYDIPEGRGFLKLKPLQVAVTLVMLILFTLILVSLVVSGSLAKAIGDQIGLGSTFVTVYGIAKWPIIVAVFVIMLSLLYYAAPNAKLPKFAWITPGSLVALVVWVVVTFLFFLYVRNFGSYNKTYGALGGAISLLVWIWISNIAILFGQELNAEVERGRQLAAGLPAERELQMPLRDEPKKDKEADAEAVSREADFRDDEDAPRGRRPDERGDDRGGSVSPKQADRLRQK